MNPNVQSVMAIERSAVSIMEDVYQDEQFLELKKALEKEKYDEEQIAIFLGNLIGRLIEFLKRHTEHVLEDGRTLNL